MGMKSLTPSRHKRSLALLAAFALIASKAANAQDSCLQRRVGPPPVPNSSHWVVTNVCGYAVQFKAYMSGTGGTFQVYTTPLGKLVDPNPGFPITIRLNSGGQQDFYFAASGAGTWIFVTENVQQVN